MKRNLGCCIITECQIQTKFLLVVFQQPKPYWFPHVCLVYTVRRRYGANQTFPGITSHWFHKTDLDHCFFSDQGSFTPPVSNRKAREIFFPSPCEGRGGWDICPVALTKVYLMQRGILICSCLNPHSSVFSLPQPTTYQRHNNALWLW